MITKRKLKYFQLLSIILIAGSLAGCGTLELGILPPESADAGLGIPDDVIVARERALTYLRDRYGEAAPPLDLQWQGDYVEQNESDGSGAYQFSSAQWVLNVEYPVVAPEATVYSIEISSSVSDFRWEGQVDARGDVSEVESAATATEPIPAEPTQAPLEPGWQTYVNERYGYEISFPAEAELEEMGIHGYPSDEQGNPVGDIPDDLEPDEVFDYLLNTYGQNLCVQITYALGYITISVPENAQFRYATCGRTGVGVGELTPREELVEVDGMEITAEGFEFRSGGDTLPEHNETLHLTLPDGTRIEYSSRASADATYQDYLAETKPVLLEILSTYSSR